MSVTLARIGLVLLVFLAPLLVLEGMVRVLIAADRLPDAPAHLRDFEISWENLERLGNADVLILGDSVTQQGIEPATLAGLLAEDVGGSPTVFNMATASAGFGVNAALVAELARDGRLPRVAVIGIQPGAMRSDTAYADVFAPSPLGGLLTGCRASRTYDEGANCLVGIVSAAWRWRGNFDRVWSALSTEAPTGSLHGAITLRSDGFRAGGGTSSARLQTQLPQALRQSPDDVPVDPAALASYVTLVGILRDHGVPVIPVAVPESPPLLRSHIERYPDWEASRQAAVAAFDAAAGIDSVYVTAFGDWWRPSMARNVNHLSQKGAAQFVHQLWAMPEFRDRLTDALGG